MKYFILLFLFINLAGAYSVNYQNNCNSFLFESLKLPPSFNRDTEKLELNIPVLSGLRLLNFDDATVYFLGGGSNGKVYRIIPHNNPPYILKHYESSEVLERDYTAFKFLESIKANYPQEMQGIEIAKVRRTDFENNLHMEDLQGSPLTSLDTNTHVNQSVKSKASQKFNKFLKSFNHLINTNLKLKYRDDLKIGLSGEAGIQVRVLDKDFGPKPINLFIKRDNILYSVSDKLYIVDPY